MFKPAGILACGLAVLAGCTTAPREAAKPPHAAKAGPPDWELSPTAKPAPTPPPTIVEPPRETITVPAPGAAPEVKWLSLNRWREERRLGELRRVAVMPLESYALATPHGLLIVTVGSRTAYWDGLDLRLGFAPQLIDGQVFVHVLDVRKNFEPLLRGFDVPAKTNRAIVIDPGHGGSNAGARSVADGRLEKEFTLDWARRLAPLLEERGWRVGLTRTNDATVSLADRVAVAEQQGADLFLSLHFNSSGLGEREQAGLETYCLTPAGMPSSLTRDYPDIPSQVFPNNAYDEQNLQYAVRLHRALLAVNGDVDRGVRRARFPGVLRGQRRPAVLVEGGYLSNLDEARRIGDPAHRQRLAEAVAGALAARMENGR
ncbi:MAG: N-acetylmuramoyl-L-alanine amidase [Verrucomicrobia bacterium]|nr:N-acetylmuramoyl-L-alanine amidase [Verrucomicrobiota bacterium]